LNDMCVHDGTMGQMLPSTDSAGRLWIVLPALLARFCGDAGVGSVAWVPAWPPIRLTPLRLSFETICRPGPRFLWHPPACRS